MTRSYNLITVIILVLAFNTSCDNSSDPAVFPKDFRNVIWELTEDDSTKIYMEFFAIDVEVTNNYTFDVECYATEKAKLIAISEAGGYFVQEISGGEFFNSSAFIKRESDELWVSGVPSFEPKDIYQISTRTKDSFEPICN
ncbi:MAG: hypothetical protein RIE52_04405 [Balneola sp.]|jgi:hypothetical protein